MPFLLVKVVKYNNNFIHYLHISNNSGTKYNECYLK